MAVHSTLERHGAQLLSGAASTILSELGAALPDVPSGRAGLRLFGYPQLSFWLGQDGAVGRLAGQFLAGCIPVRAILFDKSVDANWGVGWHQDRTISVAERRDVEGFGPWTIKDDVQHVAPPFEWLARMITLRVHLDGVPADNAPLQVALGSHRLGRVAEKDVEDLVRKSRIATCVAAAGDVWAYATPILHASERAATPSRRRVLQIDYSADSLPGDLRWIGV